MINLGSQLRQKLLAYYFTNPTASHYVRELARTLDADPANLLRELLRGERDGLFVSERRGRERYFRLNRDYPIYDEIRRIVEKTVGVVPQLRSYSDTSPKSKRPTSTARLHETNRTRRATLTSS